MIGGNYLSLVSRIHYCLKWFTLQEQGHLLTGLKFSTWDLLTLWKVYDLSPPSCVQDRLSSATVATQNIFFHN